MDYEEYQTRLDELGELLEGSFALIGKLLQRLPIPISLPPVIPLDGSRGILDKEGTALEEATERARIALLDLPVDALIAATFNALLVEWLAARELYDRAHSGPPKDYLTQALAIITHRMGSRIDLLERLLDTDH
ncbi:hypothetical protein ACWDRB_61155 [Nonomuraea sp. NPDC003707]